MAFVFPGNQIPELRDQRLSDAELFVLVDTLLAFPDAPFVYVLLAFHYSC